MKARILQKLLETDRPVHWCDGKVCVASPMCHDLISYDPSKKVLRYALDTFREGRMSLENKSDGELLAIYDKLDAMIKSGEIEEIITGSDDTFGMFPVFEGNHGEVIEEMTDKIEWPNTTHTGKMIYENTHFATFEEAAKRALSKAGYAIENRFDYIESLSEKLKLATEEIRSLKIKCEKLNEKLKDRAKP